MNAWDIRKFLLAQPRADTIRLTSGEGDVSEMKAGKGRSWSKLGQSIHALRPDLIELLDSSGTVIRAIRYDEEEQTRSAAPAIPAVLSSDPETARLTHFADLIHRAYEHSTEIAFARMIDLVERLDDRSTAIEQRLERTEAMHRRTMQDLIDAEYERIEEREARAEEAAASQPSFQDQLMSQFVGGKLTRQAPEPRPPAKANGKRNGASE